MSRYKLTFEYEGTDFSGWQRQPNVRTVEGEIEYAFSKMFQKDINIIGQGRTDAGVHALSQTAHVDLPERYSKERIEYAMRGLLPKDVALKKIEDADEDFHARFHAQSRSYRYQISVEPSPLNRRFTWEHFMEPEFNILEKCAEMITGERDFINFCIPNDEEIGTTICTILNCSWKRDNEMLQFDIEGNRFLRHMVRRLVGSMMEVATGKKSIEDFKVLLSNEPVERKAFAAPACGLILTEVKYD